jgi:hypothetical protein
MAVAYSRLRIRAHWPSDVAADTLWGIALLWLSTPAPTTGHPAPLTAGPDPGANRLVDPPHFSGRQAAPVTDADRMAVSLLGCQVGSVAVTDGPHRGRQRPMDDALEAHDQRVRHHLR